MCEGGMFFVFFNDTATTEIYTLSLHDALPIFSAATMNRFASSKLRGRIFGCGTLGGVTSLQTLCSISRQDRKSTRLNSSHANISYAVFCLKKKKYQLTPASVSPQNTHEQHFAY